MTLGRFHPDQNSRSRWHVRAVILALLIAVLHSSVISAVPVFAQALQQADAQETVDSINAQMRDKVDAISTQLEAFRNRIDGDPRDDARLAELRVEVDNIVSEMRSASDAMRARVEQIQARLQAIGEAPKEGQPEEAPAVVQERQKLIAEKSQLNLISDDAAALANNATQLATYITNLRRSLFTQTLFRHTELTGSLFTDAAMPS